MAVAAMLALVGVLALGGAVSPALDLLNHVTPLFFLAALLTLACRVWYARHLRAVSRWVLLTVGLAGGLASGLVLWPSMTAPPAERPGGTRITVMSMNLWEDNVAPEKTIRMLRDSGADVLLLQEVKGPARKVVEGLRADYPYSDDCLSTNRWCALAVLSRKPLRRTGYHQAPWRNGDNLSYVWAEVDAGTSRPFVVIDTKFVHPDVSGVQDAQVARLGEIVKRWDARRLLVAGDLNLTPWSFALRRVDRAVGLRRLSRSTATWPDRMPGSLKGLRAPFPFLPIDHIYAGDAWRPVRVVRAERSGSDHYGLLAVLSLD